MSHTLTATYSVSGSETTKSEASFTQPLPPAATIHDYMQTLASTLTELQGHYNTYFTNEMIKSGASQMEADAAAAAEDSEEGDSDSEPEDRKSVPDGKRIKI